MAARPASLSLTCKLLVSSGSSSVSSSIGKLLTTTVPLSFWGGIDPLTGIIVDTTHPLHGECVTDTIFCLPSGRGSCTASQVLLELILNEKAPKAIVLRDLDGQACVGALVAQEIFAQDGDSDGVGSSTSFRVPDMVHLGTEQYNLLLLMATQQQEGESDRNHNTSSSIASYGMVTPHGELLLGSSTELVLKQGQQQNRGAKSAVTESSSLNNLTDQEQSMLDGATSEAQRMALWVLIRYAHIVCPSLDNSLEGDTNSDYSQSQINYVDIETAHIDGCTYIGPGGLELAERLVAAGGKVQVPTTLNSVSCDRTQWQHLGVPEKYAQASLALGDAYLALGCQPSFTCAPYLLLPQQPADATDTVGPLFDKDVCWGESNAVVYANSVLGARTEKYADYLDICSALVGKTVQMGVHLPQNRLPRIILNATSVMEEIEEFSSQGGEVGRFRMDSLFPVLGHLCGTLSDGVVPILLGLESVTVTKDNLKAFCAAYGTTGTSPLIHIAGVTPEAQATETVRDFIKKVERPERAITMDDLMDTYTTLDSSSTANNSESVDLVALGNPHLSIEECKTLSELVDAVTNETKLKKKKDSVRIIACMSRELFAQAETSKLKDFGVEFINDTCWCMLLDPPVIPHATNSTILTNSGKYAHYGPGLTQRQYRFGSLHDCVTAAATGTYRARSQPAWLPQIRSFSHSVTHRRSFCSRPSRHTMGMLRRLIR